MQFRLFTIHKPALIFNQKKDDYTSHPGIFHGGEGGGALWAESVSPLMNP